MKSYSDDVLLTFLYAWMIWSTGEDTCKPRSGLLFTPTLNFDSAKQQVASMKKTDARARGSADSGLDRGADSDTGCPKGPSMQTDTSVRPRPPTVHLKHGSAQTRWLVSFTGRRRCDSQRMTLLLTTSTPLSFDVLSAPRSASC